jgi:hypothetical protein
MSRDEDLRHQENDRRREKKMIAAASRRTSGGNNGARMTSGANKTATKNRADTAADRPAHSPPVSCPTKSD